MSDKTFSNELRRALARPDADKLIRLIDSMIERDSTGANGSTEEEDDEYLEVFHCGAVDTDKVLAYVMIAAARTDKPDFLAMMGAGPLEDALRDPSDEFLNRVITEARKTPRFRWLLSVPFRVAISEQAWEAIKEFRITGDHEEPTGETLPPRPWA